MANEGEESVPENLVQEIRTSTDRELRAIIRYAQDILRERVGPTQPIEPRNDREEIVSVDDQGGYTLVIVEEEGDPKKHVYHVKFEPDIEEGDGNYHWRYIGPLAE